MASVHDIAAYILERRGSMSAMKLQKLVFYAQVGSLVQEGRPLFPERIIAWAHGPVVYELFDEHRGRFVVEPPWRKGTLPGSLVHNEPWSMRFSPSTGR